MPEPFNPLEDKHLGASVAGALLELTPIRLTELQPFSGAGIYALYYVGKFGPYRPMVERNVDDRFEQPIYVGEAVPKGSRKGLDEDDDGTGKSLYHRLKKHCRTIEQTENLDAGDFFCRYLVTKETWIGLAEALLIRKYRPIWNKLLDGFGNNDPGKGRYEQQRSPWDVLHPGRAWALKCAENPKPPEQIAAEVKAFLKAEKPKQKLFD